MFRGVESTSDYTPRAAPLFRPSRIVLAKGSARTEGRRRFTERICAAYPEAEVVEAYGVPHNRVDLGETDPLRLHERGKQTLVLGEHRSAVRFSDEGGNACPNYWHFSPYGFCPYGCHYLIGCIRQKRPDLEIGLCLEDEAMFAALDMTGNMGRCNCVL